MGIIILIMIIVICIIIFNAYGSSGTTVKTNSNQQRRYRSDMQKQTENKTNSNPQRKNRSDMQKQTENKIDWKIVSSFMELIDAGIRLAECENKDNGGKGGIMHGFFMITACDFNGKGFIELSSAIHFFIKNSVEYFDRFNSFNANRTEENAKLFLEVAKLPIQTDIFLKYIQMTNSNLDSNSLKGTYHVNVPFGTGRLYYSALCDDIRRRFPGYEITCDNEYGDINISV